MAEKLTFQETFRKRGAVNLNQGPGCPATCVVDRFGDKLFASTAVAANEHVNIKVGCALKKGVYLLHRLALADDVVVAVLFQEGFFKRCQACNIFEDQYGAAGFVLFVDQGCSIEHKCSFRIPSAHALHPVILDRFIALESLQCCFSARTAATH